MNGHSPTRAFYVARWMLRRARRGYGRPFGRVPAAIWGGDPLTVDTDVGPMLIPLHDLGSRTLLIFGRYLHEEVETHLLARLLRGRKRVIDVGASLGWYSMLAHKASPGAEIHAFEANPDVLPYLRANAAGCGIQVHATAVADRSGSLDFFCAASSNLSSASRRVGRRISVTAVALDDLSLGSVDFVKVDVEGGELAVLKGARRLRAQSPQAIWMIEADEQMLREAGSSLEELDHEMNLPPATRLFTVDPAGRWRLIERFSDMRTNLHKNVVVVPPGSTSFSPSSLAGRFGYSPSPLAGEPKSSGSRDFPRGQGRGGGFGTV